MPSRRPGCPPFFCLLALLLGPLPCSLLLAGPPADASEKARELEQVRGRIQAVQSRLGQAQEQQKTEDIRLRETERAIGKVAAQLQELRDQLQRQTRRLQALEQRREAQRDALHSERDALAAQIRAAYAMGRQERLKIILNQQDPAELSRVMVYYEYFNRDRVRRIEALAELLRQLAETETAIAAEQGRLKRLEVGELEQMDQLELAKRERNQALAALEVQIRDQSGELDRLRRDERNLGKLIEALDQALADIPVPAQQQSFGSRRGKLQWPTKGTLAARFGAPRKIGNLRWDGVVIGSREGAAVRAVHYGRVVFSGWLRGFGLLLIIDHGDGYMSLYGYNQALFKELGEWVESGERVALVGNSGGQLNAGVYFGIRHKGKPVNPQKWCSPRRGRRVGRHTPVGFPTRAIVAKAETGSEWHDETS